MNLKILRLRAAIGIAFAAVGVAIIIEVLLSPEPLNQKLLGIGFAAVLVALGLVRVRMYLAARRADGK